MGFLDEYYSYIDKECEKLQEENHTLSGFLDSSGLGKLGGLLKGTFTAGQVGLLGSSPFIDLAEDWATEQITNASSNLVNNVTGQLEKIGGDALTKARDVAFNAITAATTLHQEIIWFFAMKSAEQCIVFIDENIELLTKLRDTVRRLYNALVALSATGGFMTEYVVKLRSAILELVNAYNKLQRVRSAFKSTEQFQVSMYEQSKAHVANAGIFILPEPEKPDLSVQLQVNLANPKTIAAKKLSANKLIVQDLGIQTKSSQQYIALQSMWQVPKLTWEMLQNYNFEAAKTARINSMLSAFMTVGFPVLGLPEFLKNYILKTLDASIEECLAIVHDMSERINGGADYFDAPKTDFQVSRVDVCTRTPLWGVRVKALQVLLAGLDSSSLGRVQASNELQQIHDYAANELKKLTDIKKERTIYRRIEGREELGQLEPILLQLASNAVLAIADKTQTTATPDTDLYDQRYALTLAQNAMEFLDSALQNSNEVKDILASYIADTKPRLGAITALGDSVIALCDEMGLDKAKDSLIQGQEAFKALTSAKATYAGAALGALYGIQGLLLDSASQACLQQVINDTKVASRAQQLESARSPATNIQAMIKQNEETCADLRRKKQKTQQCIGGQMNLDAIAAAEDPGISTRLMNTFKGIFGDTMPSTDLAPTITAI